ncbi:hypothetical protein [Apibacter sp.]|uniref:hypothetical protein n=1 Tax=Apibacter sp. TaxID=2023709 RepID=UPI0025E36AFB|nr:hypothetical protein [Apibacter sp.]MCT6868763.1 hypothetical protein [Apibacter sp.]
MHTINSLAERLLGRSLTKNDGVKPSELDKIEIKLGTTLPNILRDLYLLVGKNNMLMESFNRFALPSQLQKDGNKIVFLEENQNICYWGFEIDQENVNPKVYQLLNENEWFEEQIPLIEFIIVMLYYQCAQGGYEFFGISNISDEDLEIFIHTEWEDAVRYNGLQIYWKQDCLLWYVYDHNNVRVNNLYFSARTEEAFTIHSQKYELESL